MPVPQSSPSASPRRLLRDDAFLALRTAIVDGVLEPGERLVDAELSEWLGVSRTPIREAIARLEQAGLVITTPGRSTIVSPIDVRAVTDAQHVVASLHELAVREAVPVLEESHLQRMREANADFAAALAAQDVSAASEADDRFHGVPVGVCANGALRAVLDVYSPQLRRLERHRFATFIGRSSVAQHERIIALAAAGDADGAALEARLNWLSLGPAAGACEA
jgi:DNA-binding GntR family transcriptional regulator